MLPFALPLPGFRRAGPERADFYRALRSLTAFMTPLLLAYAGALPFEPVHACIAANSVAMVDARGAYSVRLGLLLSLAAILTISAAAALPGANSLPLALAGMALITVSGGLWRHLSSDYGPGAAISSALLFLLTLGHPPAEPELYHPVLMTAAGGLLGVLVQMALWPVRPEHPLRAAVAESWEALAALLEAVTPDPNSPATAGAGTSVTQKANALRATLNTTLATLRAGHRSVRALPLLEQLHLCAARLGMRTLVLNTALDDLRGSPAFARLTPFLAPVLVSLTQTARAAALAVVSRQPAHLAAFAVRVTRVDHLLQVLRGRVAAELSAEHRVAAAQLDEILQRVAEVLPDVEKLLRDVTERAGERAAFSLELLDAQTLTLRPLAAVLNNPRRRPDPALALHTVRLTLLCLAGVAFFKFSGLPHGYWLPFTIVVVLQPDFGSTRRRAAERVAGTILGGLIASAILWNHPPAALVLAGAALSVGGFAFFLKRRYAVAATFVTIMVVLMTESTHPVTPAFALERMGCTLTGGLLALGAALIFWPVWESGRFSVILRRALRANAALLREILTRLKEGGKYHQAIIQARRVAESAGTDVFSSLNRMTGDPENQRAGLQHAAALANGNQRVTRALNVIALHLDEHPTRHPQLLEEFQRVAEEAFHLLSETLSGRNVARETRSVLAKLETFRLPIPENAGTAAASAEDVRLMRETWIFPQLSRVITELSAMLLVAGAAAGDHALNAPSPKRA